jgi:AcrR family transcriptional regulator
MAGRYRRGPVGYRSRMAEDPRSTLTRRGLIESAERLFAEHGIEAVSLRQVALAAGQRNHSVVPYHFGSKEGLVSAIFEWRMRHINERRASLLDALEQEGRIADRHALVEAFVIPLAASLTADPVSHYARFNEQVLSALPLDFTDVLEPSPNGDDRSPSLRTLARTYGLLRDGVGHLPAGRRTERVALMARFVIHALADFERDAACGRATDGDLERQVEDLVALADGMLSAP